MLPSSIVRKIRILEWIFLALHIALYLSLSYEGLLSLNTLAYALFWGLSFYCPRRCSYRQRQLYIYSELILAIAANAMDIGVNFLIYLYLGKSCFLLSRREALWITVFTGFGFALSDLYAISATAHETGDIIFNLPYGLISNNVVSILISSLSIYSGASLFVVSFCLTIIAEHKSRKRAEALSDQVEELAKTLERTRIARDIHDSLGHTLTNLNVQLQLAQRLRETDLDRAFQAIDLAHALSNQCIEDVSCALASIRRFDFDLNKATEYLVDQFCRNANVAAEIEMDLPLLPPEISHQIYSIVKECLVNIQKHAQASKIHLQGQLISSGMRLVLEDDGVGFIPGQTSTGFGLQGISERVQLLGGTLKIDSVLGKGTLIEIEIPV